MVRVSKVLGFFLLLNFLDGVEVLRFPEHVLLESAPFAPDCNLLYIDASNNVIDLANASHPEHSLVMVQCVMQLLAMMCQIHYAIIAYPYRARCRSGVIHSAIRPLFAL